MFYSLSICNCFFHIAHRIPYDDVPFIYLNMVNKDTCNEDEMLCLWSTSGKAINRMYTKAITIKTVIG